VDTAFAYNMPPATVMIMSSLPRERAAACPAFHDVLGRVGGAFRPAALGLRRSVGHRPEVGDRRRPATCGGGPTESQQAGAER